MYFCIRNEYQNELPKNDMEFSARSLWKSKYLSLLDSQVSNDIDWKRAILIQQQEVGRLRRGSIGSVTIQDMLAIHTDDENDDGDTNESAEEENWGVIQQGWDFLKAIYYRYLTREVLTSLRRSNWSIRVQKAQIYFEAI